MDEEMWEAIEPGFSVQVFDAVYEFDAPQYFDFTSPESYSGAREVDLWFETAPSCSPSPFIIKLNLKQLDNANNAQKSKDGQTMDSYYCNDSDMGIEVSEIDENNREFYSQNHMTQDKSKATAKSLLKSSLLSNSTLMKPTASHLAKQNKRQEVYSYLSRGRSQKPLVKIDEKGSPSPSVIESHASKRQKLDGGYLRKVAHLKHHTPFVHKVSKVDISLVCARPKNTIPREPILETAQRAQRHRSKNNAEPAERLTIHSFKAHPLNRKILESPSFPLPKKSMPQLPEFQEFHLKTSERALQHPSNKVVNTSNSLPISQTESMNSKSSQKCEIDHKFKARPLNKKIFISRGELGVFRNVKQDATIPIEFKFSTDKRSLRNPPIELFSKLSLTSNGQTDTISQPKSPLSAKGSKENASVSSHQELEMANDAKEKPQMLGERPNQCGSDKMIPGIGPLSNINRSLGIS